MRHNRSGRSAISFAGMFLLGAGSALAQSTADCNAVLANAYDVTMTQSSNNYVVAAKDRACRNRTSAQRVGASIVSKSVPVSLNVSNEATDAWCESREKFEVLDQRFAQTVMQVHDSVIQAWNNCMSSSAFPGARISLVTTENQKILFLGFSYTPSDVTSGPARLKSMVPVNLDCPHMPREGQPIKALTRIACTRIDEYAGASVAMNLQNVPSPTPASVPGRPRPVVPQTDLTGVYKTTGPAAVLVDQSGTNLVWEVQVERYRMDFQGHYVSPTKILGTQSRKNVLDGCSVEMVLVVDVVGPKRFCRRSWLLHPERPRCGLPEDFSEGPLCYPAS